MGFPEPPDSGIEEIEESEHKEEIFAKLLSGWSPTRVAMSLRRQYNEVIDPRDILAFLAKIASEQRLDEGELRKRYKGVDVEVDALLEIQMVLRLQKDELDAALLQERLRKKADGVLGNDIESNRRVRMAMGKYWEMLLEYIITMHKIGELPEPQGIKPMVLQGKQVTIQELIRMRKTVVSDTGVIGRIESGGVIEVEGEVKEVVGEITSGTDA